MDKKIFYIFVLIVFGLPWVAAAETMYVNDNLEVMIRGGKGVEFKILAIKKAHEPLEVLRTEDDYCYVRTEGGVEGWVLRRYLTRELPDPMVIADLRTEIEKLKGEHAALNQEYQQLQEQKKTAVDTSAQLGEKTKELESQYQELKASSANVISIKKEHDRLADENRKNALTISQLTEKNRQFRDYAMLLWFIAGASTLLIGVLLGAVIQGLRYKRKRSFSF
jgi:SH3 domain protein